jgi:hypothetical protein
MSDPSDPSDPTTSPPAPHWRLSNFQTTVPFRLEGRFEYTSWSDLERTLGAELRFADLPQLHLEFGQEVSHLQAGVGVQLFEARLGRVGPLMVNLGSEAMLRWADSQQLELGADLEINHVQWPNLGFFLEGSVGFEAADGGVDVSGAILGGLRLNFDIYSGPGTWRRR